MTMGIKTNRYSAIKTLEFFSPDHKKIIVFLILSIITKLTSSENGSDHYKSISCQRISSCSENSTAFDFLRSCQCDDQCYKYGDCCKDSKNYKPSNIVDCVEVGNWNIRGSGLYVDSYYMIRSCPSSWEGEDTVNKCVNYLKTAKEEPLFGLPITSNSTNITYANYHCAKCNNDLNIKTMIRWKLAVSCGNGTDHPFPDLDEVLKVSTFEGGFIKPKFDTAYHSCKLVVWRPMDLLRKCYKTMIDKCKSSWKNETVKRSCEEYTSIVFSGKPYRNRDCAICNNKKEKYLKCTTEDYRPETFFQMLFDTSDMSASEVGRTRICPNKDEAYDIVAKKCRNIIFSITGNEGNHENYKSDENIKSNMHNCSRFVLKSYEYVMNDNLTAMDLDSGKMYNKGDYFINSEGEMEVCADEYQLTRKKFGVGMQIVTFIGLGVSVIGLVLHLLAFTVNPVLRNLSGKNLASLCVALLIAYVSFIVGILTNVGALTCKVSAVVTYYSFLASFTWLLMMAFDVWRTLRLSTLHLRMVSRERRWRLFILYSIISWLLFPGILVSAAMITQNNPVDITYWPAFGVHNCWFGNRSALLIFFVVPIGIIMAFNIVFYILSAYMICSSNITPSNKSSNAQQNYKLFARLAVLMGLTWISGFVADFLDVEAVWYIFIFLNAFQGVFIFIAFTLTQRVRSAIRTQVSGDSKVGSDDTPEGCWSHGGKKLLSTRTTTTTVKKNSHDMINYK